MPRLTDTEYLDNHVRLKQAWTNNRRLYSRLSPLEQWRLHAYYQPSKLVTNAQLLSHRRSVTTSQPPLPQQAGRAMAKLNSLPLNNPQQYHPANAAGSGQRVFVQSVVVQPELDLKKLARVFIAMAEREMARERETV